MPDEPPKYVGYLYPDGIIKYDGSSPPQIDETVNKETLYSSLQRYLDRLADSTRFAIHDSTSTRCSYCIVTTLAPFTHTLSVTLCHSLLPSSFMYPNVVLHFRVVGQSLHIIIQSGRITSSHRRQGFLPRLSFVWMRCI